MQYGVLGYQGQSLNRIMGGGGLQTTCNSSGMFVGAGELVLSF